MSLFPNKFLLNILACGLILSHPLTMTTAADNTAKKQPSAQAEISWTNYSYPESGFSIDLPKKPEHVQQSIDIPKSSLKINYETYLSEPSDNVVYVVSVWKYPAQVDMSKPEVNLQDGFKGMLSALSGSEVLNMHMGESQGFKTLEFLVKNQDIYFQGKLILVHNTLYQIFSVYKNSEDMTDNYKHFINSFKLLNPEQHKVEKPLNTPSSESNKVSV